jgi:hypothetical protein
VNGSPHSSKINAFDIPVIPAIIGEGIPLIAPCDLDVSLRMQSADAPIRQRSPEI